MEGKERKKKPGPVLRMLLDRRPWTGGGPFLALYLSFASFSVQPARRRNANRSSTPSEQY